ncbi:unnamed protein product [Parnassius apollo]|uniref:(apollo) hypothetical protein n=1 Tax=Parnassius apollo TaxID=110799 RepID=A0A8S3XBU7_PARAO|nr:unnamed protein product [Parnassius apollo]
MKTCIGLVANGVKDEKKETSNNTWLVGGVFGVAGCEHARFIRSVVSSWRLAEVFVLCEQLEAGRRAARSARAGRAGTRAGARAARRPARCTARQVVVRRGAGGRRLVTGGTSCHTSRQVFVLQGTAAEVSQVVVCSGCRVPLEGVGASLSKEELQASVRALYAGPAAPRRLRPVLQMGEECKSGVRPRHHKRGEHRL